MYYCKFALARLIAPNMPSACKPTEACQSLAAAMVSLPQFPSTVNFAPWPFRNICHTWHELPLLPSLTTPVPIAAATVSLNGAVVVQAVHFAPVVVSYIAPFGQVIGATTDIVAVHFAPVFVSNIAPAGHNTAAVAGVVVVELVVVLPPAVVEVVVDPLVVVVVVVVVVVLLLLEVWPEATVIIPVLAAAK